MLPDLLEVPHLHDVRILKIWSASIPSLFSLYQANMDKLDTGK